MELVVASKMNGMTDGFLVRLRNAQLTDAYFPILMIVHNPNDSIISGTCDLSSNGMPFHASTLIAQIEKDIKNSQLPIAGALLLENELKDKKADRFCDQTSIDSYSNLLTVLDRGFLKTEDYHSFGLLEDPEGSGLTDAKKIRERLALNRKIFDQIDWVIQHGSIEDDLDKEFDQNLIDHLARCKRKSLPWDQSQTLQMVISSQEKMKKKLGNPLEVLDETLDVYSGSPIEYSFSLDKLVFLKADGDTKAKRRNKNILIYNPDHRKTVTILLSANIPLRENWVQCLGAEASVSARNIIITMKASGCCFSGTKITDASNNISYNIKICILDLQPRYLETIQTSYQLSVSQYQKRCAIQAFGIGKTLLINPNQPYQEQASLTDHGLYTCNFDHTLALSVDDESIPPDSGVCSITLKCGAVEIPLQIKDECCCTETAPP